MSLSTSISGGGGGGGTAGAVVGPGSSTDNAVVRWDGTTGALAQDSAVTVSDVSGSSVTVATTAGNSLAVVATAPAATTGASQAGKTVSITASNAVASTDTNGAAAGGSVTITAGAAARRSTGDANGGDINLTTGAGIGTGTTGKVVLPSGAAVNWSTDAGLARSSAGVVKVTDGSTGLGTINASVFQTLHTSGTIVGFYVDSGGFVQMRSSTAICWANGTNALSGIDTQLIRGASGVVAASVGSNLINGTFGAASYLTQATNAATSTKTYVSELLTLNTGATTTATSANLAPANSRLVAILVRVTTTITTAANFNVKVTGGNAFSQIGTATTSNSTLTAGTTYVLVPSAFADQYNTSATTLTVTTNANPGAGALRLTMVYEQFVAPTS